MGSLPRRGAAPFERHRLASLDLLRFAAVLLVLIQHYNPVPEYLLHFGWMGVDLFFVLSGFLVTGLLFSEYKARGDADAVRFLVRRGFKIYPPFWAMIAATCLALALKHSHLSVKALLCEMFFVQNYGPGLWVHTWSLAVEEHFYLAAAVAVIWWRHQAVRELLRRIGYLRAAVLFLVAILVLRCLTVALVPPHFKLLKFGTHMRVDSLFAGAIVSYIYHWHQGRLKAFVGRHRLQLGLGAGLLLLPMAHFALESRFTLILGFSLVYLSAVAVLLLTIFASSLQGDLPTLVRGAAFLGKYSYGTYLWHVVVRDLFIEPYMPSALRTASWWGFGVFAVLSFAVGVVLTRIVEIPALALRDRAFPAKASALDPP